MTLEAAKKLKKKMTWKDIYYDSIHDCYRLIDRANWYEYRDSEGYFHKRQNPDTLILIAS
jgi:hypothetical protein